VRPAKKRNLAPLYTSTSQEWYTPACVLDRVIELFGEIDLDPCSNSHEHPSVVARHHLTAQDDGLAQRWSGKVFCNPPFCDVEKWIRKVLDEYASGRVTEALLLVPSRTDTKWASLLRNAPRCYLKGRLKFVPGEGVPEEKRRNGATFGSALFYLGPNPGRFTDVFGRGPGCLGDVFVRVP
jgi:phage N-6-adenine-methyltransferase